MNVISLFSGAGGLDLGFKKAGANIIFANDKFEDAVETYKNHIGKHIDLKDIYKLNPNDLEIEEENVDVIVGGYPCLGFTVAQGKNRDVEDEKNFLYLEYLKFVETFKPKMFVVENVPGMKRGEDFRPFFDEMLRRFKKIENVTGVEYDIEHRILLASNYGVPQKRERIIIIAKRKDMNINFEWPKKTHSSEIKNNMFEQHLKPVITLKDAIKDLPLDTETKNDNHVWSKHKVKINGYMGNRKLEWDEPSPTIIGRGSRSGGPVIHPHPSLKRRLSVRECARLQSFPDDIFFKGCMTSGYAQVGNAVPPLLAFRIAQSVMLSLGEKPNKYNPNDWDLPWKNDIPEVL